MRAALFILMTWLALLPAAAAPARHVAMTLVAESERPAAGGEVALAVAAVPDADWHGYWLNPGDAGVGTRVVWDLPAGVTAGPLAYPVPERLLVAGLMNHVYARPWALLTRLRVPAGLAAGTRLPVAATLDYLVCTDALCVPERQTLTTVLTVGDGAVAAARRARFDAWRRELPRPLGSAARYQVADGRFRLEVPFPRDAPLGEAWFYPAAGGATDYAAPQAVAREGDRLVIETRAAAAPAGGRVAGVLATGDGRGLSLTALPGQVAAARSGWGAAALAFAGAVLGGLLLNVMPCVFPILSLKALSLARSGESARAARGEALAYTAGVVSVCLALGATLLALRAAGAGVGWAFQLQDPRVVGVLLLLTVAITLNLLGLFALPVPRFAGGGAGGAFATGALAAFVATPCSGPFMGAALGAALVLPAGAALLVFAGLGLGIALPFLAIGFVPALRRRLPRPGAWMVTLRRVLAVPMLLTAMALAWLLWRQAGGVGLLLGAAAAAVLAAALWAGRRGQALAGAALALAGVAAIRPEARVPARIAGATPFSEAALAAARREGPVFAYFTADWCLTCKVNERAAIETDAVAAAFRRRGVRVLVGDWTDGDPALGRFIEAQGRAGVPLYLWYAPGEARPRVLPQVLTQGMLVAAAG